MESPFFNEKSIKMPTKNRIFRLLRDKKALFYA